MPVVLALGLLLASLGIGGAIAATPAAPFSTSATGGVQVTFPTAYPRVELSEVGNASAGSTLALEQVLEVALPPTGPVVVAVALPTQVTGTTDPAGGAPPAQLPDLSAVLTVYPSDAALWAGPGNLVQPNGAPLGTAHVWINYSAVPSTSGGSGVVANWSVVDWPWVNGTDLLGVQMAVSTPSARSLVGCTGSALLPRCPGVEDFPGTDAFRPGITGIEEGIDGGPTAAVSWAPGLGAPAHDSVGVFASSADLAEIVLAAPMGGTAVASGGVTFALLPPTAPIASLAPLRGEVPAYAAGGAIAGGTALAGLLLARRGRRRAESEL